MAREDWSQPHRIEAEYRNALRRALRMLERRTAGITDPAAFAAALRRAADEPEYTAYCDAAARRMVTLTANRQARTWREAASKASRGRMIYTALREQLNGTCMGAAVASRVAENAHLIRSLPYDLARDAAEYAAQEAAKGRRSADIAKELKAKLPRISESKARLIARTEASKAGTALIEAQAADLGLDWYIWRTSGDGRVRTSHADMDGVLVAWSDPPAPEAMAGEGNAPGAYHAGNIYNCRCYPEPVLDLEALSWPMRVHTGGGIVTMTYAQFMRKAA